MVEDARYLVTRGRRYWLQLATPRPLRDRLPHMLQKSLGTSSLSEAQTLRWAYVNGWNHAWKLAAADKNMTREEVDRIAAAEIEKLQILERGG